MIPAKQDGIGCLPEAAAMMSLKHPYINTAVQVDVDPENIYIVQELAECTLTQELHTRPSTETLVEWCFQLASAVKFLSSLGLVHGDIKSDNVLVFIENGRRIVKLADLGLITPVKKDSVTKRVYTRTHRPLEIWKDNKVTLKADVWALGATFLEMFVQRTPIPPGVENYEDSVPHYEAVTELLVDLPEAVRDLIEKMLRPLETRISIHEVVSNKLFKDFKYQPGTTVAVTPRIKDYSLLASKYTTEYDVLTKVNTLVSSLSKFKTKLVPKLTDDHKIRVAVLIACKLLQLPIPDVLKPQLHVTIKLEREVCKYLDFAMFFS